ncbi:hypothetical protein APR50_31985 [Variovorax paradoxus]|jgi:MFS family permease|nr:hypothetical protein APR52_27270 [Variovorax paradoxus]KPV00749.1 hypothetical protein APR50_31985 [Variovorax paradoxus]KPV05350.1 hypothetical protein APR49_22235 [Variovorax paradoxus]KPV17066.1 hypothetical protein APR51_28210 [Variovorax paradoxus]KPV27243.1 hypothetical protein APR47_31580 [Variovorax paradoxus]
MRSVKAKQELVHRIRLNEASGNALTKQGLAKYLSLFAEYVVRNPVALATSAALTLGGLLLLGFFLRIGFMPDVDLAGSMALLFAAALVGIGTLIALILATVLPGVSMRYLLDDAKIPVNWSSVLATAGPAVLSITLAVLSPLMLEPAKRPSIWVISLGCWAIAPILGISLIWFAQRRATPFTWRAQLQKIWPFFVSSVLWTLGLFQVLQAAIYMGVDSPHPQVLTIVLLAVWLLLIGAINLFMTRIPLRVSLIVGPIAGIFSLAVLALLTSSYSTVSATTMRMLGIGDIPSTNLLLTADTCQALSAAPGTLHCEALPDKATAGVLKDVTILSRIGSNVVVEGQIPKADPTQPRPRLILRKEAVIAWTMPGTKGR